MENNKNWYGIATTKPGSIISDINKDDSDLERWTKLSGDDEISKLAESAIEGNTSKISFSGAAVVEEIFDGLNIADKPDKFYLAAYCGGLNGEARPHKWENYIEDVKKIMGTFEHSWMINLENDCPDDIWYLVIGFRK